jgi:hypothetical protein
MMRQAAAVMLVSLGASSAAASLVTFVVSGTLDSGFDILHAGDPFKFTYTIDTSITGNLIFQDPQTTWVNFDNVTASTVTIGAWSASATSGVTEQIDSPGFDNYEVFAGPVVGPPLGGMDAVTFNLELFDTSGALVPDAFTPLTNFASYDDNALWVIFRNDVDQRAAHGRISTIGVLPEPATTTLLVIGFTCLLWTLAGRRRG